jgi:hypothetical protein
MKLRLGDLVEYTGKEHWGVGCVFKLQGRHTLVFFENVGKKRFDPAEALSKLSQGPPMLKGLHKLDWDKAHHNVYVVELSPEVLKHPKFRAANPGYREGSPCYYVGLTGLSPAERFENHRAGHKSNYYVHKYGSRLVPELYENFNPMPYELADRIEGHLADLLRIDGSAVWQN